MRSNRFRDPIAVLLMLFGLASIGAGRVRAVEPSPASPELEAMIESLRRTVQESALDDAQRQAALSQIDGAVEATQAATVARQQLAELRADASGARDEMDGQTTRLPVEEGELALQEWIARLPANASAEALEKLLEVQRKAAADLSEEIRSVEREIADILARPAEASIEIAALRRRADELSGPIPAQEGEAPLAMEARRLHRSAELRRIEAELDLRQAEQDTGLERQRRRERALDEMRFRQRLDDRRIDWLQARIAERTRQELESRVARLAAIEASIADKASVAATVARENRELGEEILAQSDRLAADRKALSTQLPERDRVATALTESRTRLELGGTSQEVGRWLWSERRGLESPARLERRLEDVRRELAVLRLRLVTRSDAQRELVDLPAAARSLLESGRAEAVDEGTVARVGAALEPLLQDRVDLLRRLEPVLQRRVRTLEQSETTLQDQLEKTQALHQLLDRYLLWTPSHAPIDSTWFSRVPEGVSDLVKPTRWATTVGLVWQQICARPLLWTGALLVLMVAFELRRRAPVRIREQEPITRQIDADHIAVTLHTLLWTLAAALPIPTVFALLGWLLEEAGTPGRYTDSVGRTCLALVVPLFAIQALWWSSIEQGLGHAHFRWTRARRQALRRAVPRTLALVFPSYFVTTLAFIRNLDLPNDIQARTAVAIACGTLAYTFWRLLEPGQIWVIRGVETEPSALRRALRVTLPMASLVSIGLALAGWVYTAGLLLNAWIASLCVVIGVALAVGTLGRWFLIGERKLALRRLEEQRAAAGGSTSDEGGGERGASEISLEQVNVQTRSVLRLLRVGLLVVGLVWVWAELLPAVTRLDEIVLWTFHDTDADGRPVVAPVSLMAALFGALALALTTLSARNLPGLVELGLQSQTNIDGASRYAITSLLRYAIVIVGSLIGLELLGLRWSQLQWMAAALTVGLGFGLQEIFANFVSGLILLFERPFRVGDVISVGELTGRVTRIRTRATTILDFDNREIVVPNKSFITGQLLNWTLSDTTTRVTIKVGVAYGTDPDRVHRLLMEAAAAHPLVLSEPEPRSWFLAFGASSLDFELRVFVATLADRLQVQSELHEAIARLFAENGIEIAFPQMDLHVRDLPDGVSAVDRTPGAGH